MAWTFWIALGCVLAALGIGLSAFVFHILKNKLHQNNLNLFELAVRYQMYHAFALIFLGLVITRIDNWAVHLAGFLFAVGILAFSGSLYLVAIFDKKKFNLVVPWGAALLVLGWIVFAIAAIHI
jgi:uncharacterized membrane protein YgdD (TMEM256/DUF423 family)